MTSRSDQEAVARLFERLTALDADGFLELFAPEGRQLLPYAPPGFPEGFRGLAELDKACRQLVHDDREVQFPELSIEPMADPERFVATYSTPIRFADERQYGNRYIASFHVRDSRIVEWVEYFARSRCKPSSATCSRTSRRRPRSFAHRLRPDHS